MSLRVFVVDKILRFQMKRRFARRPDPMLLRPMMGKLAKQQEAPPARVTVAQVSLAGVPCERLETAGASTTAALLYLHGGAFVAGSPATHRALTWRLADGLAVPVVVPDYRLAPEHPFPAGLDDVVAVYRALRGERARVVVAGDSAGGNLALALTLRLRELGAPPPDALMCLSPATEMAETLPSHVENAERDAMFVPMLRPAVVALYCPHADAAQPLVSPLRADVRGFPPTLIQCSQVEMLRDDGVQMGDALRAAGVDARTSVWPQVWHVWQLSADLLPEARRAVADLVAFARPFLAP